MEEAERQPLVSVVITAYNAERYIGETLESVFAQTYRTFEVIVADDGSTDGTRELVQTRFPKVRYFWKPNGGQASARNLGITNAEGDLLAFVDSDDLWLPEKLTQQVRLFIEDPTLAWSYTDCYSFVGRPDNITYRFSRIAKPHVGNILPQLFLNNFIPSPTVMIRRTVFEALGLWDENVLLAEDWNMWLRIAARFPIKYLDEPLALYRRHGDSMVSNTSAQDNLDAHLQVLRQTLKHNSDQLRPLWRPALANLYFKIGLGYLKCGMSATGRLCLARAIWYNPQKLQLYGFLAAALFPAPAILRLNWLRYKWRRKNI